MLRLSIFIPDSVMATLSKRFSQSVDYGIAKNNKMSGIMQMGVHRNNTSQKPGTKKRLPNYF